MNMNYGKVGAAYQNAERQAVAEINDPHAIVLTMFDELVKSMTIFADNVDMAEYLSKSRNILPAR
jgi:hypothetical protein